MPSLREQLLVRVEAALQAGNTGAVSVSRSREKTITKDQAPAIVVMPSGNELQRMATGADRNAFEFAIEIFVRGDPWDQLADPVDVLAHAALMGDAQLWTILQDLRRVAEDFEAQEADRTAGTLTVRYRATFLTNGRAIDKTALV